MATFYKVRRHLVTEGGDGKPVRQAEEVGQVGLVLNRFADWCKYSGVEYVADSYAPGGGFGVDLRTGATFTVIGAPVPNNQYEEAFANGTFGGPGEQELWRAARGRRAALEAARKAEVAGMVQRFPAAEVAVLRRARRQAQAAFLRAPQAAAWEKEAEALADLEKWREVQREAQQARAAAVAAEREAMLAISGVVEVAVKEVISAERAAAGRRAHYENMTVAGSEEEQAEARRAAQESEHEAAVAQRRALEVSAKVGVEAEAAAAAEAARRVLVADNDCVMAAVMVAGADKKFNYIKDGRTSTAREKALRAEAREAKAKRRAAVLGRRSLGWQARAAAAAAEAEALEAALEAAESVDLEEVA